MSKIETVLGERAQAAAVRVIDRVRTYVELESPSRDKARVTILASAIAADLREAGCDVQVLDAPEYGANVVATFGDSVAAPHLTVLMHMDTVHPVGTLASQPFRVRDDRIEGPGVYDMKTGIALAVESLRLLTRRGTKLRRQIRLLVTCDEEIGSHRSLALIKEHAQGARAVLVTEPCLPGGGVKTERKGVYTYRLSVEGRAAHAGTDPQSGVSATHELAAQILRVMKLADAEKGTTVNVGVIAGGTASNVVAAHAMADIDVRARVAGEAKRVDAALHALKPVLEGANVKITGTEMRPPLERTEGVVELYKQARVVAHELGVDLKEGVSGGGSDGSFTADMGIPTLDGLSADGGGAHAADEHVLVADLPFRLAFLTRLLETL